MNIQINDLIEYPKQGILSKDIAKGSRLNVTLFCMAKGAELDEHTSTKEGTVHVIEGKGIFNLKGKNITMEKGRFIFMEKNAIHSLKAHENTSFLLSLV